MLSAAAESRIGRVVARSFDEVGETGEALAGRLGIGQAAVAEPRPSPGCVRTFNQGQSCARASPRSEGPILPIEPSDGNRRSEHACRTLLESGKRTWGNSIS